MSPWHNFLYNVRADIERYIATGARSKWRVIFLYQAFWASFIYRFTDFLRKYFYKSPIRVLSSAISIILEKIIQIITGISLPVGCDIGSGLYIAHFGGIIVHPNAKLGKNCNLGVQVVIGYGRYKGQFGCPTLGDRVFIGPGAKILGPVMIGNDVAIGANAVVVTDVPDRAFVGGIPAKIINYAGSFDYVFYAGMEKDPARLASRKQAIDSGERSEFDEDRLYPANP